LVPRRFQRALDTDKPPAPKSWMGRLKRVFAAEHYPRFVREIERACGYLPGFVRQEFEDYLNCGRLEHGFMRVKCGRCRSEHLVALSCNPIVRGGALSPSVYSKLLSIRTS